jgi:hypothetical protein
MCNFSYIIALYVSVLQMLIYYCRNKLIFTNLMTLLTVTEKNVSNKS